MKGKYHIVVQNNRLRYEMDIRRNITIIRGDSATGKTKLINLLEHPEDFIESQEYFSWERFFTTLLVEHTRDTHLKYSKSQLNGAYLHEKTKQAILSAAEGVDWKKSMENLNHGGR